MTAQRGSVGPQDSTWSTFETTLKQLFFLRIRGSRDGGRRTGGRGEGGSLVRGLGVAEGADERGQQPESAWLAQPAEHLARGAHARPQLPDEGIQAHPHLWARVRKTEHDGRAQEPLHLGECRGRLPRHHERLDAAQALDFTLSRMFADCSMASRPRERPGASGKDDIVIDLEMFRRYVISAPPRNNLKV